MLERTAVGRQVIVFTHDNRLAQAVRQLSIPAAIQGGEVLPRLNAWGPRFADTYKALNKGAHAAHDGDLVAGVLAIGNEYSTGMIKLSLTAMPRRLTWFFAKATVLTAPVLTGSALAVAGAALAGRRHDCQSL